tara:strand:+ start:6755 stop:6931 length:177 start_codon:yes stop_codon:yes gene_type:complete
MAIRVKMLITLDIDTEEYVVPADGRVHEEIADYVQETFHDLEGAEIKHLRVTSEEIYR